MTAIILGHADDVVDTAVKEQIDKGSLYSLNSPLEIELAEILVDTIPSAEMVRYTKGGGEACAVAVRIARGTTGKDKILFSGYHGWHDWYQSANYLVDPESGDFPFAGIEPIGVPRALAGTALPFTYGNLDSLEKLFAENRGEVAAVMMEAMRSQPPKPGYLGSGEGALSRQRRALHPGRGVVGLAVVPGQRARVARRDAGHVHLRQVHVKRLRHGLRGRLPRGDGARRPHVRVEFVLERGRRPGGVDCNNHRTQAAQRTRRALGKLARRSRQRCRMPSIRSASPLQLLAFTPCRRWNVRSAGPCNLKKPIETLFIQEMVKRGIFCLMTFTATLAHSDEDIAITAAAAAESFEVVKRALAGELDTLLEAETKREPFRRLVR